MATVERVVILIPGMLGAGCTSVAVELSRRIGLHVVNTERIVREIVAEKRISFMELSAMVRDGEVDLEGIVRSVALDYLREGGVIVEGRTALMLLDQPATLKAFLYADRKVRIERVARRRGISVEEAEREVERSDEERRRLVERLYGRELTDPALYDVMLNTSNIPPEEAVDLIEAMLKPRLERLNKGSSQ
ncbi:MAG: hypothetical protein DRJ96_02900 [Thermoprotei archaeon]|nr:MAG: hypothetical protein DRJ96_02900 [Thermoprotei archaeon]